ncbi:uncharacterized protein si:ch211-227n13.3 isoform X2 [Cheilinus undulatus]|nr:uncharacterized protein si:ch211-227n13.3 isoform X2 [Cheilinus undulatus]
MFPRRSSRPPKPSQRFQRSTSPNEEVIKRKSASKRQRKMGLKNSKADNIAVKTDDRRDRDILDVIDRTHKTKDVKEDDEEKIVEVPDAGVDESDEDYSDNCSVVSGPSVFFEVGPEKEKPSQSLCSACQKLYQKAKKMKAPLKNKLLDNDPKSLTCDQWVLLKSWRPKRLPCAKGKLLTYVTLVKRKLRFKTSANPTEQCVGESACLRPHTFLQRNLRQCVRAPLKKVTKKTRRKRKTADPWGSRVTKQRRLHNNSHHQRVDSDRADKNGQHAARKVVDSPAPESGNDQEMDTVTVELIPCSVTLEPAIEAPANQNTAKKRGGFRDLLAQLRGNSSMIVRETH